MWKFKAKPESENEPIVKYFDTLQEVADYMALFCESSELADIMAVQKEWNIRFYISRINKK